MFHQKFDNYVYRDSNVYFVNYRRLTPTIVVPEVGTFAFVAGVPATVDGAEAEVSFQIKPRWNVSGNVSYADGQVENGTIACTDLNGDGIPDANAAQPTLAQLMAAVGAGQNVSQCQFSGRASFVPEWTANCRPMRRSSSLRALTASFAPWPPTHRTMRRTRAMLSMTSTATRS